MGVEVTDLTKSVSPFTIREKLYRGAWTYLAEPLVRWLPRSASPLRIAALRLFGAEIGPTCLLERGVSVLIPKNLKLTGFVAIGRNVEIYNYGRIEIGKMSVISQYAYLCTGTHDYQHPYMPLIWKPIMIGSECWIAAGAFIGPGVTIGDGVVVGARASVTRNLAAWMVYAGNPCRPIKPRVIRTLS